MYGLDNALMSSKDKMLAMLNNAEGDSEFLEAAQLVFDLLEFNFEIYASSGYAYKGREIADRIDRQLWDMTTHCNHRRRLDRIQRLRETAWKLSERYHVAQNEYMEEGHAALGLKYQTNMELAS